MHKYFYNENVYRLSHTSGEFKERMQAGLECIGGIDVYSMGEVIMLAEKSLMTISSRYVLDISHMGYLAALLDAIGLTDEARPAVLRCISEKNAPEIKKLSAALGIAPCDCERLMDLAALYGPFEETVGQLREIGGAATREAVEELEAVWRTVRALGAGENIHLDFSIVNDMNYYNGIIFRGFVDGIPTGILSGGRYDNLMQRFGKTSGAIGFAVYLDLLERFEAPLRSYDVDVLLLCDAGTGPEALAQTVKTLTDRGWSVRAATALPDNVKYRQLVTLKDGRLEGIDGLD
jgi:ATP phosphoribosyltransferase regulatory subunit